MQFFLVKCLLVLATTRTVLAQTAGFDVITAPAQGSTLLAGSTFNIHWTPSAPIGKISIILLAGTTQQSLQPGPIIASSVDSSLGTFAWTVVPKAADIYGFKLQLDSNTATFQFSYPFTISGGSISSSVIGGGGTESSGPMTKSTIGASDTVLATTTPITSSPTPMALASIISSSGLASAQGSSASSTSGSQTSSSISSSSITKATSGATSYAPARAAGILGAIVVAVVIL